MTDERVRRCFGAGMSILVATVDSRGTPSCCRGVALTSSDDLETATVYVPMATSQEIIRDVATTRRIAVTANEPIGHVSLQLKGTSESARLARDDEAAFVRARVDAYADVLDSIGIPRRITRAMAYWPAFAIDMRIDQIFEQTPGPKAGTRVR